jgi:general secretion pathway protein G
MVRNSKTRENRGFTLIELMIVISLLLILITVAIPIYKQSILRARESVLRQDLFTLRQVIDQYTLDKQKAPQSLDDLISAGYMKQLPVDPFTGKNDTWKVATEEDTIADPSQTEAGGISDVHSGSDLPSTDGSAYSSW